MQLDDRDLRLLQLLQEDNRIATAALAEQVGMSTSACWRRIRAFEEAGIITGYGARVDPVQLGLGFQAIVHVHLTRHDPAQLVEFIRAVEARDEVMDCFATTGQADYHLRVLCRDIAAYNQFLEGFLFRLPAVQSAQTNVVLREIKSGTICPV
ncbi:MAG: Lrp/AsnC family transcriptional regulator [Rhodobacteraceae bacterium]|nr:MAG: Lrp/AsnC family transcriptional regulator [Paracoccaceae bacterium]